MVLLLQDGFFFFLFEGKFHGMLQRINAMHQQMGAVCTRLVRGQAFVFSSRQGLSVVHPPWTGCPSADLERSLHNLKFMQQIRVYSIDTVSAYLWLKSQQNILWSCQHDRPPLINTCQMLKLGDETPSMTRLEFLFFYFFPTRLNEYKSPGKCII